MWTISACCTRPTAAKPDSSTCPRSLPALERLRFERWQEGLCMQVMHVGPYAEEARSIVLLYQAIAAAGYSPRGHHHEIYLGDPRRSAPEKLRTILRQPVGHDQTVVQ
ncbi:MULTISPECIES: GyrI-like domain-containing protein [unclassified Kribbella]|uniref:GyrI-like domain-containing protein n=1 Tax=unclassified Kribbella TaxID=2644121 RepID=UPI003017464D